MLVWLKRLLISFAAFGLITFLGPLLIAAITTALSLNAPPDPLEARTEAEKLVSAFRDEEKNKVVMYSIPPPPDGAECGYDPSKLFPGDQLSESIDEQRFTPYWGYFVLDQWRADFEWNAFNHRVAEELNQRVGDFQLGFLRRCITTTLARDICMSQVEELIHASAKEVPRSRGGTQSIYRGTINDVVCLYADGVAARIDLPMRSIEQE